MTKFLDKSFSTYAPGDSSYRENWEATFGKRDSADDQHTGQGMASARAEWKRTAAPLAGAPAWKRAGIDLNPDNFETHDPKTARANHYKAEGQSRADEYGTPLNGEDLAESRSASASHETLATGSAQTLEREHEADRQRWQRMLTALYEELKGNRISAAITRLELFRWDATPCASVAPDAEKAPETAPEPTCHNGCCEGTHCYAPEPDHCHEVGGCRDCPYEKR